ncbi:hypothetical protein L596_013746 [Steinernema carpocapsae]|uniref:Uncharacterized protein n=1 Tax=Steinernema carpocapsae TaxID=34508 RepID=A0A4U5P1U4_STECR|nr:hypothetical protein L596_013746 [Steinernema carpocapsae]
MFLTPVFWVTLLLGFGASDDATASIDPASSDKISIAPISCNLILCAEGFTCKNGQCIRTTPCPLCFCPKCFPIKCPPCAPCAPCGGPILTAAQ